MFFFLYVTIDNISSSNKPVNQTLSADDNISTTQAKFSDPEFPPTPECIAKDNEKTSFDYFDSAANVARW